MKPRDLYALLIPKSKEIEVPTDPQNKEFWEKIAKYQFIYSMTSLSLGLVSTIGGIILFLHGISGSISWTAKLFGFNSKISDAPPGAILFIVGLFIIWATRFSVKIK